MTFLCAYQPAIISNSPVCDGSQTRPCWWKLVVSPLVALMIDKRQTLVVEEAIVTCICLQDVEDYHNIIINYVTLLVTLFYDFHIRAYSDACANVGYQALFSLPPPPFESLDSRLHMHMRTDVYRAFSFYVISHVTMK